MLKAAFILLGLGAFLAAQAHAQPITLRATPEQQRGSFGFAVAIDGDYAVVGAPFDEIDRGVAYVFFRDPVLGWTQQARLTNSDRAIGDAFGYAVAISGTFVLIGAPGGGDEGGGDAGAAYVFFNDPAQGWIEQDRLTARDPASEDRYGYTVALSGIYALVGAPFDDDDGPDSGSAYAYTFTGPSGWVHQDKLTASNASAGDTFGAAVALDDRMALIGAPNADDPRGAGAGLAYLFEQSGGTAWVGRALLTAGDAAAGNRFGAAVALNTEPLSGIQYALIGAPDAGTRDVGAAYIFTPLDMLWTQIERLAPGEGVSGDNVGAAVALSGTHVLVGVPGTDAGDFNTNTGAAYLFVGDPTVGWREDAALFAPVPEPNACFACTLALDGNHLLVGAWGLDDTMPDAGAVFVYDRTALNTRRETPPEAPSFPIRSITYPNPFVHATTIAFDVPAAPARRLPVRLAIYDVQGREIAVLTDRLLEPGRHTVTWTPPDAPSGVYIYQLRIGSQTHAQPLLRLR